MAEKEMREWINLALNTTKIAKENDLNTKRVLAKKIFGSNLTLMTKKAHGLATGAWKIIEENGQCPVFVTPYDLTRTFFDEDF